MWKLLMLFGVILVTIGLFYFLQLAYYLFNSFEFTNYGFGVLSGKILILTIGVIFLYFGIKIKNK